MQPLITRQVAAFCTCGIGYNAGWLRQKSRQQTVGVTGRQELGTAGKSAVALVLTTVGGFVDAVGYIALYQIFTANMSGNSVHVGMYLGTADLADLARPLCAILAYLLGMIATRILMEVSARARFQRIASFTLAVEALLLTTFASAAPAMHVGQIADLRSPAHFFLVAILAFAMGVQCGTLTHVGPLTIYTTFVTGTLTKMSESFTRALFWYWDRAHATKGSLTEIARSALNQRDVSDTMFLAGTWICYVLGAAIGTLTKDRWELRSLFLPVAILVTFIVLDQFRPIGVQEEQHQQALSSH